MKEEEKKLVEEEYRECMDALKLVLTDIKDLLEEHNKKLDQDNK